MKWRLAVAVAALCGLSPQAYADTVYLRSGESVWGREVMEDGETVIVVRPSGTLRFPKRDVKRIEREKTSLPKHYQPPPADVRDEGRTVDRAARPPAAPTPPGAAAPAPPQTPATTPQPAAAPPAGEGPSRLAPTVLPPPPPPPYAPR